MTMEFYSVYIIGSYAYIKSGLPTHIPRCYQNSCNTRIYYPLVAFIVLYKQCCTSQISWANHASKTTLANLSVVTMSHKTIYTQDTVM